MKTKFDMVVTNVELDTQKNHIPALILKGVIVKKSLWRNKLVIGDVFNEKLYTAHIMELLIPALKELRMKDPVELIGTIQHMHKQFTSEPAWQDDIPRWIPRPWGFSPFSF